MTRLRGKRGSLAWLWIVVTVIVTGLAVLGLDYLDIWQLGLY